MRLATFSICVGLAAGYVLTAAEPQTPTGGSGERFAKGNWSAATIRMDRDVVKVGDKIRLFVDRVNISGQPILVGEELKNRRAADSKYRVQVRGEKGELAPETKWGRRVRTGKKDSGDPETVEVGSYHERYVQPGESYTDGIELDGQYELNQPGKYTAQIVDVDEKGNVIFESNKVTFTITK